MAVSTSAPSRSTACAVSATRLATESTAQARPVSPDLIASAAISAASLQPTMSTRSPSLMPDIATVSGSLVCFFNQAMDVGGRGALRLAARLARAAGPRRKDDIVRCCEKSRENTVNIKQKQQWKARGHARRHGGRQHDDDRRRARDSTRAREADRIVDADGHRAARQTHRRPLPADQGFRAAGVARRHRVRRMGHLRRQLVRGGEDRRRACQGASRADSSGARTDPARGPPFSIVST